MIPPADSKRLAACLAVSCLLHAALVLMPYLGVSKALSRLALPGGQKPNPARSLNATLSRESRSSFAAAAPAPQAAAGGGKGDPAAERVSNEAPRPALTRTEGMGLLPLPAPAYYSSEQLTKRPLPTAEAALDTAETWAIPATGKIILKLWIDERGEVTAVDVEKSELPEIFSKTAAAAFKTLRFLPGELHGQRVRSMMRIEVIYDDSQRAPP